MTYLPLTIVMTLLLVPVNAYAQGTLEAEIRAAISSSAQEQGLTASEIDSLVLALADSAAAQDVLAEDIAANQVAMVSQEMAPVSVSEEVASTTPVALSFTLILLAVFVLWLWRKMRQGGALGPHELS